jgi:carboxymethylenebutenolidase
MRTVRAPAPFDPPIVRDYGFLDEGSCPVVASFGRKDPLNIDTGPRLHDVLERANVSNGIKVHATAIAGQLVLRVAGSGDDPAGTDASRSRRGFAFVGEHLAVGG